MEIITYIRGFYEKNQLFVKYAIIGASGVALDFLAFYILNVQLHVYYQYANIISVSLGITNNFFWNAFFNFRVTDKMLGRFVKFYLVGLLGLGLSSLLLYLLIDLASLMPLLAKAITMIVVVLVQFTLNKKFSFKQTAIE